MNAKTPAVKSVPAKKAPAVKAPAVKAAPAAAAPAVKAPAKKAPAAAAPAVKAPAKKAPAAAPAVKAPAKKAPAAPAAVVVGNRFKGEAEARNALLSEAASAKALTAAAKALTAAALLRNATPMTGKVAKPLSATAYPPLTTGVLKCHGACGLVLAASRFAWVGTAEQAAGRHVECWLCSLDRQNVNKARKGLGLEPLPRPRADVASAS